MSGPPTTDTPPHTDSTETVLARLSGLLPGRADWHHIRRRPGHDLIAGLTVAIVALPLALAFGISAGMGAQAGLITAIVAGSLAAIFGGSNLQVSGPTGAMAVILVPVVHAHGVNGVLTVGLLAGIILIAAGVLRAGRAARYLPVPVIEGFTAGIAVVIALQQVPAALGLPGHGHKVWQAALHAIATYVQHPHAAPLVMAVAVAAGMLVAARWRPAVPFSLVAVAVATAAAKLLHLHMPTIGALHAGLPAPSLGFLDAHTVGTLLPSAFAVAALAALESLLSATVADGMTVGHKHDPDRELVGQGIANLGAAMFGGMPATAAIARTAVNVRAGASSRLAALIHAATLAAIVFSLSGLVSKIPLAALAGVLLATCVRMVEVGSITALVRSTRGDALVLTLTLVITVAFDLVTAVAVGVAVAVVLALHAIARHSRLEQVPLDTSDHAAEEHELLSEHIVAYRLDGPLFFAAAHRFLLELSSIATVRIVILRMSRITTLDATGARVLDDAIARLEHRGITVLLSGIHDSHDQILARLGVADHLRAAGRIFDDTRAAIAYARALIHLDRQPPPVAA